MFIFHLMFMSREEKKKVSKVQKNSKRIPNAWCQCAKDVKQKSVVVQLNWSESYQTKYMYLYLFRHFHWNCSWTVPNGSSSTEQNTNIYTFIQTYVYTSILKSQNVRYPLYSPPQIRTQYTNTAGFNFNGKTHDPFPCSSPVSSLALKLRFISHHQAMLFC